MIYEADYSIPRRTIYGLNSVEKLKNELESLKTNILYVTYKTNGQYLPFHFKILNMLKTTSNNIFVFDEVDPEPNIQKIDKAAEHARENNIKIIIAVGGGSVIDLGKAISVLLTNPGSIREYQMGNKEVKNEGIDIIAIPTTAGTGAEATKVAVITNKEEKIKKSIIHPNLVPYLVILDPNLTKTLSPKLTALTGIDALSHSIEAYTSNLEIPFAKATAIKSIELIGNNLVKCYRNPDNLDARMGMLLASYLGGISTIASAGAAHRLAQPISSETGLSHSEAISVILVNVMKINRKYCMEKFRDIAFSLGVDICEINLDSASKAAINKVQEIYNILKIKQSFSNYNIGPDKFSSIIENANRTTSHLIYNAKPIDDGILREVLEMSK